MKFPHGGLLTGGENDKILTVVEVGRVPRYENAALLHSFPYNHKYYIMQVEITGATVLLSEGEDCVLLDTNLPCSYVADFLPLQPCVTLRFGATYNTGVAYCVKHLGIVPKIINTRM